jgi:hypothetical protein
MFLPNRPAGHALAVVLTWSCTLLCLGALLGVLAAWARCPPATTSAACY